MSSVIDRSSSADAQALAVAVREVDEFVAAAHWSQPPQLFALVPTADLLKREPELAGQVDAAAVLTPIAQESLPDKPLDTVLSGVVWPAAVHGCVLTQEIVVLPPAAEAELANAQHDEQQAARIAAEHPERREARLVVGVLRDGTAWCTLRLRASAPDKADELVHSSDLAPNLVAALRHTFED